MGLLRMTYQWTLMTSLLFAVTAMSQQPVVEYYIVPAVNYGGTVYQKIPPGIPLECLQVTEHGSRKFAPVYQGLDRNDEDKYSDSDRPLLRSPRRDLLMDELLNAHQGSGDRVKYNDVPPKPLPDSPLPPLRQKQFGIMPEDLAQIRNYSDEEKSEYRPGGYMLCFFKLWAFRPKLFYGSEKPATKPNLRPQQ